MLMSCSGFVLETENVTNQANALPLPSVLILIAFAVVFNVSMAMICHLVPSPEEIPGPYQPRTIVESEGPGSAKQLAAGVVAPLMERGQAYLQAREDFRKASHQAARKLVGDYLEEHPDASIEEIRKETKLSRQTIIDHRREILGQ